MFKRDSSGTKQDNFYAPTSTIPGGEQWCEVHKPLDPKMSSDGFGLLDARSVLYSQKNIQPRLRAVLYSDMESSVNVNHFYCTQVVDSPEDIESVKDL